MKISLLPFADVDQEVIHVLKKELEALGGGIIVLPSEQIPRQSYSPIRGQYLAKFLSDVANMKEGDVVLGVTDIDLYSGDLNFVLGVADIKSGKGAVISTNRLKSADRNLFLGRAVKEAFHEIGHLKGLKHCDDVRCVMHFSNRVADTDVKEKEYCQSCRGRMIEL